MSPRVIKVLFVVILIAFTGLVARVEFNDHNIRATQQKICEDEALFIKAHNAFVDAVLEVVLESETLTEEEKQLRIEAYEPMRLPAIACEGGL